MKTKECKYKNHVGDRILPISDFRKCTANKDGLAAQCIVCADAINKRTCEKNPRIVLERKKARKRKLMERFREWKTNKGCKCCDETVPVCLELHHLKPDEKEIHLADALRRGWCWDRIMKEAAKCVVLCANCHRKVHAGIIVLDDKK